MIAMALSLIRIIKRVPRLGRIEPIPRVLLRVAHQHAMKEWVHINTLLCCVGVIATVIHRLLCVYILRNIPIIVFYFSSAQMHSQLITAMLPAAGFWILKYRYDWIIVHNAAMCLHQIWAHCPELTRTFPRKSAYAPRPCCANAFTLFELSLFSCAEVLMKETVGGFYSCLSSQSVLHTRHSRMCSREAALFCKHGLPPQYYQIHLVDACERCLHGLLCLHDSQDIAI